MLLCKDVDLLYWEPDLLREAVFASQLLASGTGDLNGTAFTVTAGPRLDLQKVEPGHVLVLDAPNPVCLAITIVGQSGLNVSSLYADLFPASGTPAAAVQGTIASALPFVIRTFWAQRRIVSNLLLALSGLEPGAAASQGATVLNPQSLKRAATLGTLQMIYATLAATAPEPARYNTRADLYERLFRRALRQASVEIDLNGDGRPDAMRLLGVVRMGRE